MREKNQPLTTILIGMLSAISMNVQADPPSSYSPVVIKEDFQTNEPKESK